jgi:hypothetical protein
MADPHRDLVVASSHLECFKDVLVAVARELAGALDRVDVLDVGQHKIGRLP